MRLSNLLAGTASPFIGIPIGYSLNGFGFQSITPVDLEGDLAAPAGMKPLFIRHRDDESHTNGTPDLRVLLTRQISDSIQPILAQYSDLSIEWSETLPPAALAERLRSADLFILPSLEEGMARTALEAMACGLPVILTPNTGACDLVNEAVNGSIVPIRDSEAIVEKAIFWRNRTMGSGVRPGVSLDRTMLDFSHFSQRLAVFLKKITLPNGR